MNKRICLFLPNLCIGGAERSAVNIANGLAKKGYNIDVVLSKKQGEYISNLNKNINIVDLNKNKVSQSIMELYKYIQNNEPECIISFMDHCNIIATIVNKISGNKTKVIATIHSTISQRRSNFKNEFLKVIQRKIYKYIHKIVVVSKEAGEDAKEILKIDKDKLHIIYNPIINDDIFEKSKDKIRHKWVGNKDFFTIIGVGRLTDEKGFEDLIEAFKIVKYQNTNARLIILGEGDNRSNLEELIRNSKLNNFIDMPGFVNPYPYMRLANLFVLSSKREGLPSALIESMALGTRVVSTNCKSGPKEILQNGKLGKLVEVGNVYELSESINTSIKKYTKVDYKDSLDKFSENNVISQYIDLIKM